jgi:4-hydroxy-3-methylbut-2-enyl diphosphate reductase
VITVEKALELYGAPVYVRKQIVHNKHVVATLEARGAIFVDQTDEVPEGKIVVFSAHGVSPAVHAEAADRNLKTIDATCPLVTKVHHELRVRSNKGYKIIYIGHEGHEEAVGTMAVAPHATTRVEKIEDVAALTDTNEPLALLAQTTLSHRDWQEVAQAVKVRFPQVWQPGKSDLCFATTNRQTALMQIVQECDAVIIIGSSNSSNTLALEKLARSMNCKTVLRINSADEIPENISGTVGVTAGASAPEELVMAVVNRLAPRLGVEEVRLTTEDEYFPPPRNIRQLQHAIEQASTVMIGGNFLSGQHLDDRSVSASTVLQKLTS